MDPGSGAGVTILDHRLGSGAGVTVRRPG